MTATHPMPDHGAESELSRFFPLVDYDTVGLIPGSGKIETWQPPDADLETFVGIGNMVTFTPWCLFEALDGDPTQVQNVEVFVHYTQSTPRLQDTTLNPGTYFPRRRWTTQDVRPVQHPDYAGCTRLKLQWQSYFLQDLRTQEHPLDPGGGSPIPTATLKPTFWEIAAGDWLYIGLWFHSVGGLPGSPPVLRDGEYFRLAAAFGGMARTY